MIKTITAVTGEFLRASPNSSKIHDDATKVHVCKSQDMLVRNMYNCDYQRIHFPFLTRSLYVGSPLADAKCDQMLFQGLASFCLLLHCL